MPRNEFLATFVCHCDQTSYGERVKIVGDSSGLGNWNGSTTKCCLETTPETWPRWISSPQKVVCGTQFKCIIVGPDGTTKRWEGGENRVIPNVIVKRRGAHLCVTWDKAGVTVTGAWEAVPATAAAAAGTQDPTYFPPTVNFGATWKGRRIQFARSQSALKRAAVESAAAVAASTSDRYGGGSNHPAAVAGVNELCSRATEAKSYLDKLSLAADVVVKASNGLRQQTEDSGNSATPHLQALAGVAVYLHLVRTGLIPCIEAGSHHRPCHHAERGLVIFRELFQLSTETAKHLPSTQRNSLNMISRRLMPLLPSFNARFTAPVPLTRIRDIAHRNDIPTELKLKVKHTLQNKLHRSAAPEDLVAAEIMWEDIRRQPLSDGFKHEFQLFLAELREFFGAQSLLQHLEALPSTFGENHSSLVTPELKTALQRFISCRARLSSGHAEANAVLNCLENAATLRRVLTKPRMDASLPMPALHELWLTDVGLDSAVFVLLSQLADATVEGWGWGTVGVDDFSDERWEACWHALQLAVTHVMFNGNSNGEGQILLQQIALVRRCWFGGSEGQLSFRTQQHPFSDEPEGLLLFAKATLERVQLFVDNYVNLALDLFPKVASAVGMATGAPAHSVAVDAEAEVRASTAFQLSRLATGLLGQITAGLGSSGVEVVVTPPRGMRICGRVKTIGDIWQLSSQVTLVPEEPLIVVLQSANGDEEVAGLRDHHKVACLILLHSIPHLSHLAVRLRQEKLPFLSVVQPQCDFMDKLTAYDSEVAEVCFDGRDAPDLKLLNQNEVLALQVLVATGTPRSRSPVRASSGGTGRFDNTANTNGPTHYTLSPSSNPRTTTSHLETTCTPTNADNELEWPGILRETDVTAAQAGAKAATCATLKCLADKSSDKIFSAPNCWVLPFGCMEATLQVQGRLAEYSRLLHDIESIESSEGNCSPCPSEQDGQQSTRETGDVIVGTLDSLLQQLQGVITSLSLSPRQFASLVEDLSTIASDLSHVSGGETNEHNGLPAKPMAPPAQINLIARSSANFEDLEGMSAAGLYESIGNINPLRDFSQFSSAVVAVWASLHSRRAVLSRQLALVKQSQARMAVLLQDMCRPYLAFVLHTRSPIAVSEDIVSKCGLQRGGISLEPDAWIYMEAALGLGEILASGSDRGNPFRLLIHKASHRYALLSLSSFARKFDTSFGNDSKGCSSPPTPSVSAPPAAPSALPRATEFIQARRTNFATDIFTLSRPLRQLIASKIARCAAALESYFGGPQDVEGSVLLPEAFYDGYSVYDSLEVCEDQQVKIVVVQSRPQPV